MQISRRAVGSWAVVGGRLSVAHKVGGRFGCLARSVFRSHRRNVDLLIEVILSVIFKDAEHSDAPLNLIRQQIMAL